MNFQIKSTAFLLVIFLFLQETFSKLIPSLRDAKDNDDADLDVPQLLKKYGYPSEIHYVTTPDGYILQMHRIPYGRKSPKTQGKKKVLFLMHGILASSSDWILTGPDNGLGYIMADRGYDVWLGNARGNVYSRNHTKLDPDKDSEFWQFSWHEIGAIDLPTKLDYILNQTGVDGVYYSGHSQGTTTFYVMTSVRPEYNKKIKVHVSLAPIAFMNHLTSPLLHAISLVEASLEAVLPLIGVDEFMPSDDFLKGMTEPICNAGDMAQSFCQNAVFALVGFNYKEMNDTLFPALLSHVPAGASTKQLLHYAQEINSGHFRPYDHGMIQNMLKYNSVSPPDYKLDQIVAPVHLIYSNNDWMSAVEDVDRLSEQLGNFKEKHLVKDKQFNHMDYLYGIHAPEYVYKRLIDIMSKYD